MEELVKNLYMVFSGSQKGPACLSDETLSCGVKQEKDMDLVVCSQKSLRDAFPETLNEIFSRGENTTLENSPHPP